MEKDSGDLLSALEAKVTAKEQTNLQNFQKQILQQLRVIRESLVAESAKSEPVVAKTDQKDNRIAKLQAQNHRLSNRISHLVRNLREARK